MFTAPDITTLDTTISVPQKYFTHGTQRPWTDEDRALLIACAAQGLTQREAALRLGRTKNSVGVYACTHGISFRKVRRAARTV